MAYDPQFGKYLEGTYQSFNPYGAGNKVYEGGRSAPNVGPTANRAGYLERDRAAKARRNALLRRMKATQAGKRMNPDYLRKKNYYG